MLTGFASPEEQVVNPGDRNGGGDLKYAQAYAVPTGQGSDERSHHVACQANKGRRPALPEPVAQKTLAKYLVTPLGQGPWHQVSKTIGRRVRRARIISIERV